MSGSAALTINKKGFSPRSGNTTQEGGSDGDDGDDDDDDDEDAELDIKNSDLIVRQFMVNLELVSPGEHASPVA